jgi:hypothetical protein
MARLGKYVAVASIACVITLLIYDANTTKNLSTNHTASDDTQSTQLADSSSAQNAITGSADALSSAIPPDSFRGIKWDSELPSIKRLHRTAMIGCASISEQTSFETIMPCSHMHIDTDDIDSFDQRENVPPFLDVTVSEQMFTWSHQKFWSGEFFLQNKSDLSKLKRQLVSRYGSPTFENNSLPVTKWRWSTPNRNLSIQLYADNHGVVSVLFTQDE